MASSGTDAKVATLVLSAAWTTRTYMGPWAVEAHVVVDMLITTFPRATNISDYMHSAPDNRLQPLFGLYTLLYYCYAITMNLLLSLTTVPVPE